MIRYPKNLLFLDFDGCMTSIEDDTYFNPDPEKYVVSECILKKIMNFCRLTSSKIVISSNWRKFDENGQWTNSGSSFKNPLAKFKKKLGKFYFDTLPAIRHVKKPIALKCWFELNPLFKGHFAIFDDDMCEGYLDMNDFSINAHFICVSAETGITDENLLTALEILNT